jgi:hypothetical protein
MIGQKITLKWANDPHLGHLWGCKFEVIKRSPSRVSSLLPQYWNKYLHYFIVRDLDNGDELELSNSEIEMSFRPIKEETQNNEDE